MHAILSNLDSNLMSGYLVRTWIGELVPSVDCENLSNAVSVEVMNELGRVHRHQVRLDQWITELPEQATRLAAKCEEELESRDT